MTEHRSPGRQPTLDDYCAMMRNTHAPDRLKQGVLGRARARRASAGGSFGAPRRSVQAAPRPSVHAAARRSVRAGAALKRTRMKPFGAAACAILLVGAAACGLALGIPGIAPSVGGGDNSFSLAAYAAEGSGAQPGTAVALNADQFKGTGGYSGAWYDPDAGRFAAYDEWAGFKYSFDMQCSGSNIKKVSYEIEGDHAFFETLDGPARESQDRADNTSSFHYSKSVSFDYDDQRHGFGSFSTNQQEGKDDYVVSIYLGFPLPELARDIGYEIIAGTASDAAFYDQMASIDLEAARTLATCRLHLTATFEDGSTQTKTYTITPVDDVEQRISDFWNASHLAGPDERPNPPALFALTEIEGS